MSSQKRENLLAYQILLFVLVGSLLFTILTSVVQLYSDYQRDVALLESQMEQIRESYVGGIANSVWDFDTEGIKIQLDGVLNLPNIAYVGLDTPDDFSYSIGERPSETSGLSRTYPLLYEYRGKTEEVGTVEVVASFAEMYERIQKRFFIILITQIIQAFLLAGGILLMMNYLVASPLNSIAKSTQQIDLEHINEPLTLNRKTLKWFKNDELDQLVTSINDMQTRLVADNKRRKEAEEALRRLNIELEQRVIERTQRLKMIAKLGEQLNAILDVETLLNELVNQVKERFAYYHVHIYILDKKVQNLVMQAGYGEAGVAMKVRAHAISLDAPTSLVAQAARTQKVVAVDNVRESVDWLANPLLPDTHSEMAVPIITNEQVVGVLDVQQDTIGGLDEGDASLLRSLANQVAVAITNARLFAQNQATLQETETLYTIGQRMITATNLSELIAAVVEEVNIPVINRAVLGVFEYDSSDNLVGMTIEANWYSGHGTEPTLPGTHYTSQMLDVLTLFSSVEPLFFEDIWQDERIGLSTMAVVKQLSIRAVMVLPLPGQQQQLGVLLLEGEAPYQFSDREIRPYLAMLGQLATAVENQQLLQQTIQAKEKADLANRAKSEFLGNMSHELRTPLNGILGYAQLLKRKRNLETDVRDGLGIIQQSGNHLLTLITDILDFSKIEAHKMELYLTKVNLPSFIEEVVGIMWMRATEKNILFEHETHNLPNGVLVDEKRLRQILLNLLGNAVKFTKTGRVTLRVSQVEKRKRSKRRRSVKNRNDISVFLMELEKNDGKDNVTPPQAIIRFEVEDTGMGMTSEQTTKIFEAFEQVGDVKKRAEGTGLGLAITKQLVELMGGNLQVRSQLGQGTTFWFEINLPFVEMDEPMMHSTNETIVGYQGARRKVLIVDDIVSNRTMLVGLLEPLGFGLTTAENGLDGIAQAKQYQPDIILTDLVMPEMDGFGLIKGVQAESEIADTPILILSASSFDKQQWNEAIQLSDGFLNKPFAVNDLFDMMASCLNLEWEMVTETDKANDEATEMIIPPVEELKTLHGLAQRGSMKKVRQWVQYIIEMDEQYRPFANQVMALAKAYEGQEIEKLAEQYLSE
ncbi:ATP-binding protein [Anaerolineales bacterium HSG25]|nr:ATP-binding protein [Anaerolineales bacterium HSG25]